MAFSFMHAADIHLDSPMRGLERYESAPVEQMRSATRVALKNLVADCIAQGVAFLVLVGDLYDGDWRDYNTGLFLLQQMAVLREAGIDVYIVRGNHDAESSMTRSLERLANMHVFGSSRASTKRIEALNVAIHGQSYGRAAVLDDLSLGYPEPVPGLFNIGLLHTSADGSYGHDPYAPCSVPRLVDRGYDYWALGHVHRREVLATEPHVVFPGNLQGRHARETGAKGATLVTVGDRVTIEHRELDAMRWFVREVAVDAASSAAHAVDLVLEDLTALRRAQGHRPLAVRVRLVGRSAAHRELTARGEQWTNQIRAGSGDLDGVWLEKIEFVTRAPIDLEAMRMHASPLGELLRTIDAHRADERQLVELGAELKVIRDKLVAADERSELGFDQPDVLRPLLDEVEQMLIPLLLDAGDDA